MDAKADQLKCPEIRFYSTVDVPGLDDCLLDSNCPPEDLPSLEDLLKSSGSALLLCCRGSLQDPQLCEKIREGFEPLDLHVIYLGSLQDWKEAHLPNEILHAVLGPQTSAEEILIALESLRTHQQGVQECASLQSRLDHQQAEMDRVLAISQALVAQDDLDTLLRLMLEECMDLTCADAGSLFLVDTLRGLPKDLVVRISQTRSIVDCTSYDAFKLPLNRKSIAGYVALTGEPLIIEDVHHLDSSLGISFDQCYDLSQGYRSKSMLAVPLIDHRKRIIGVMQLINAKPCNTAFRDLEDLETHTKPFSAAGQNLVMAVAGQAAVAIENTWLYTEIEDLFSSFVNASVTAIESRDPSTGGHSSRVADLTIALAEAVDRCTEGEFARIFFTAAQIRELRYASLLHDFGKVGVRENVLVKPRKLTDLALCKVNSRLLWLKKELEFREARMEPLPLTLSVVEECFELVKEANEPRPLSKPVAERLPEIASLEFLDWQGKRRRLLSELELEVLLIPRGSLTPSEWVDMQSHVIHTRDFLDQIPWTGDLAQVPYFAGSHHEKLDGTGYPNGVRAADIPLEGRIMAIADIFDALTASDRCYKKAIPLDRALQILRFEAKDGHIDTALLDLFVDQGLYAVVLSKT
jgi:HD-GYP domain-containing protein (c-di-GMP phosphodiesterase class II)